MLNKIKKYINQISGIEFAYIYGSYASGKELPVSDIDIAIYCKPPLDMITLGLHISKIEKITGRRIDLTQINGLDIKNPAFSYEIITTGKLINEGNKNVHNNFKWNTYRYYFDTEYLRNLNQKALINRIKTGTYGKANHTG